MGKSAAGLLLKVLCNCSDCPRVVTDLGVKVSQATYKIIEGGPHASGPKFMAAAKYLAALSLRLLVGDDSALRFV